MSGDTDNPKITLDKIRFLEDFKKTVEKEKTIINNIYNVEILKENENMESDDEDDEIEIEWSHNLNNMDIYIKKQRWKFILIAKLLYLLELHLFL